MEGGPGDDTAWGRGGEVMFGGDGNDVLGNAARLVGGAGDDELDYAPLADGGPGDDRIDLSERGHRDARYERTQAVGGPGNDEVAAVFLGHSTHIDAGSGNDLVRLYRSVADPGTPSLIELGDGNDSATTAFGADRIIGGPGEDSLSSLAGNDLLDGGSGADTCDGGIGHDKGRSCETTTSVEVRRP